MALIWIKSLLLHYYCTIGSREEICLWYYAALIVLDNDPTASLNHFIHCFCASTTNPIGYWRHFVFTCLCICVFLHAYGHAGGGILRLACYQLLVVLCCLFIYVYLVFDVGCAVEALRHSGDNWKSCDILFPFAPWRQLLHHCICTAGDYLSLAEVMLYFRFLKCDQL